VTMLRVIDLSVKFGSAQIVKRVSFELEEQQWLMLVGPNGAGKSTLINAISRGVPYTGSVLLHGRNISGMKPQELARHMGVLAQSHNVAYSFSVEEVVKLGRYAYSGGVFSSPPAEDDRMVDEALEMTGMTSLRGHSVLTLSGGELQRTFLAQIFAQDPQLLILDEPANYLDLLYQKQVFDLIREWVKKPGRAVVSVVHDLSLAKAYGTNAVLMHRGRIISSGSVGEVLSKANLRVAYDMDIYEWMNKMLSQWQ